MTEGSLKSIALNELSPGNEWVRCEWVVIINRNKNTIIIRMNIFIAVSFTILLANYLISIFLEYIWIFQNNRI